MPFRWIVLEFQICELGICEPPTFFVATPTHLGITSCNHPFVAYCYKLVVVNYPFHNLSVTLRDSTELILQCHLSFVQLQLQPGCELYPLRIKPFFAWYGHAKTHTNTQKLLWVNQTQPYMHNVSCAVALTRLKLLLFAGQCSTDQRNNWSSAKMFQTSSKDREVSLPSLSSNAGSHRLVISGSFW